MRAEEIGSFFMFECPCDSSNKIYGLTYLFGPTILLLIGGIWMQSDYWKLLTGLLNRSQIGYNNGKKEPRDMFAKLKIIVLSLLKCIAKAIAAPLAWLMVGLLKGEDLACALWLGLRRINFSNITQGG